MSVLYNSKKKPMARTIPMWQQFFAGMPDCCKKPNDRLKQPVSSRELMLSQPSPRPRPLVNNLQPGKSSCYSAFLALLRWKNLPTSPLLFDVSGQNVFLFAYFPSIEVGIRIVS
jgi:hypothetical protein